MGAGWFVAGFVAGAGAAAALGVWSSTTPQGQRWRRDMMDTSDRVADDVAATAEHLAGRAQETIGAVKQQGQKVVHEARGAAADVAATADDAPYSATVYPSSAGR